jgi:hypothetical protein
MGSGGTRVSDGKVIKACLTALCQSDAQITTSFGDAVAKLNRGDADNIYALALFMSSEAYAGHAIKYFERNHNLGCPITLSEDLKLAFWDSLPDFLQFEPGIQNFFPLVISKFLPAKRKFPHLKTVLEVKDRGYLREFVTGLKSPDVMDLVRESLDHLRTDELLRFFPFLLTQHREVFFEIVKDLLTNDAVELAISGWLRSSLSPSIAGNEDIIVSLLARYLCMSQSRRFARSFEFYLNSHLFSFDVMNYDTLFKELAKYIVDAPGRIATELMRDIVIVNCEAHARQLVVHTLRLPDFGGSEILLKLHGQPGIAPAINVIFSVGICAFFVRTPPNHDFVRAMADGQGSCDVHFEYYIMRKIVPLFLEGLNVQLTTILNIWKRSRSMAPLCSILRSMKSNETGQLVGDIRSSPGAFLNALFAIASSPCVREKPNHAHFLTELVGSLSDQIVHSAEPVEGMCDTVLRFVTAGEKSTIGLNTLITKALNGELAEPDFTIEYAEQVIMTVVTEDHRKSEGLIHPKKEALDKSPSKKQEVHRAKRKKQTAADANMTLIDLPPPRNDEYDEEEEEKKNDEVQRESDSSDSSEEAIGGSDVRSASSITRLFGTRNKKN